MTAYFLDLDGTLLDFGTGTAAAGAQDLLKALDKEGHQVFITTRRGDHEWEKHPKYSKSATEKILRELGWDHYPVIWNVSSPRVIINDEGALGITIDKNEGFTDKWITKISSLVYSEGHWYDKNG